MPKLSRRPALPLIPLALAFALAACNSAEPPSPPAATGELTGEATEAVAVTPSQAVTKTGTDAGVPEGLTPLSCAANIGSARAAKLVAQCIRLSPATHPPCNAANSCALIEDEIARSCSLLGDDATGEPACGKGPRSGEAAVSAIRRYYSAINAHDLPTAWAVWGESGNPEQTYDEFAKGYAMTRRTSVEVGKAGAVEGAAGSLYVDVPVTVDAELTNGKRQRFTGSYTLRQVNQGMGVSSQGWHITAATLRPAR